MKKLLSLAAALLCTSFTFGQPVMKKIPVQIRFHYMTENGKYMFNVEQGFIGIYNTETDEYTAIEPIIAGVTGDRDMGNDLGMGNSATDDGLMAGGFDNRPAIRDIENGTEWTFLSTKHEFKGYGCANAITNDRKYIIGYVQSGKGVGATMTIPLIWTLKGDGTYGDAEDLPYPAKDFTGAAPKYILPNCISEDGTVIAGQILLLDNFCQPIVWRKAQDGTWTYEVYGKDLCKPDVEFPEITENTAVEPNIYDYMTQESAAAYDQDTKEYQDSTLAYNTGQSTKWPEYWPDPKLYMGDLLDDYNTAWDKFAADDLAWSEQLRAYRNVFFANVTPDFYTQNGVWLSTNGKHYAATSEYNYAQGNSVLFSVGETMERQKFEDKLRGVCVTDDGDLFVTDFSTAYVYPAGSKDMLTLPDWLRLKGETEAAEWLEKNVSTGTAICSGDGRVISGFTGGSSGAQSWIIKLDGNTTGIADATADDDSRVKVYDLQGRFVKEGAASEVRTGLRRGIYIINNKKVVIR